MGHHTTRNLPHSRSTYVRKSVNISLIVLMRILKIVMGIAIEIVYLGKTVSHKVLQSHNGKNNNKKPG